MRLVMSFEFKPDPTKFSPADQDQHSMAAYFTNSLHDGDFTVGDLFRECPDGIVTFEVDGLSVGSRPVVAAEDGGCPMCSGLPTGVYPEGAG